MDLSVHATVILKSLTAQLVSKEESYRQLANKALVSMGKQMSDADAVQEVVKSLMGFLKGLEMLNPWWNCFKTTIEFGLLPNGGSRFNNLACVVFLVTDRHAMGS